MTPPRRVQEGECPGGATRRRLAHDERGDADMIAYVLMVGVLVVFAGILYVVTSNLADQDLRTDRIVVTPIEAQEGQVMLVLIKAGPTAPYNLDPSVPTGNDVMVTIDGVQCDYSSGHFRVTGDDDEWAQSEA